MANPYTQPTLSGFNSSPPADDGTAVASNEIKWSNTINKVGDPLKTFAEAVDTNVLAAFATVFKTTENVFNDDSADIDFRVEGNGDANLLFCDAGNDRIGIGTATPATTLEVAGNVTVTSSGGGAGAAPEMKLFRDSSSPAVADYVGILTFAGRTDAAVETIYGQIGPQLSDPSAGSMDSALYFRRQVAGILTDAFVLGTARASFNDDKNDVDLRVRGAVDDNLLYVDAGNDRVGIGTATPAELLDVDGTCRATAFNVAGTAGADYGPAAVASITVVKGIVTAIS